MTKKERLKLFYNVSAKYGMDSPELVKEYAKAVSMFEGVSDLADIRASMGAMTPNLPPQQQNNAVTAPISSNPPQSTAQAVSGSNGPIMP